MSFARTPAQPQQPPPPQADSPVAGRSASLPQQAMGIGMHGASHAQQSTLLGQQATAQTNAAVSQVTPRLLELLEQIKNEFVSVSANVSRQMLQKDEADSKLIQQHMNELNQVRKTIYELNQAHRQMRDRYEAEITKLKQRLDAVQHQPPLLSRIQKGDDHQGQPTLQPLPVPQDEQKGHKPGSQEFHNISARQGSSKPGAPQPVAPQTTSSVQLPGPTQLSTISPQAVPESQPAAVSPGHGRMVDSAPQDKESATEDAGSTAENRGSNSTISFTSAPVAPDSGLNGSTNESNVSIPPPVDPTNGSAPSTAQQSKAESAANVDVTANAPSSEKYLINLVTSKIPEKFKKETDEYTVIYNPELPRNLDVELVSSLTHNSVVCCVRFSNDGRYLATGCNRSAQIFDVNTGELLYRLQDPDVDDTVDLYIRSVCFSPDGKYLATGAEDHKVRAWQIKNKEIKHVFDGHEQDIYSLVFAASGRYVVSGSGDRHVKMWDMESGKCFREFLIEDGVTAVAISPDDKYIAAGSLDKSVRVWDIESNALVERLEGPNGHEDSVYSVSYRPSGNQLVSGSLDKTLKVWTFNENAPLQGKVKTTVSGHNDYVLSVAVTSDSKWILSGSKDRTVQMWSAETGEAQLMIQAHVNSVISVAPAPAGSLFASGGGDFTAKIWRYSETA